MKVVRTLMLVLAVSVCAHAGEMDNGRPQPPPPPSTQAGGDMLTPPLVEFALTLLALF